MAGHDDADPFVAGDTGKQPVARFACGGGNAARRFGAFPDNGAVDDAQFLAQAGNDLCLGSG